jgi:hypothetical protein
MDNKKFSGEFKKLIEKYRGLNFTDKAIDALLDEIDPWIEVIIHKFDLDLKK